MNSPKLNNGTKDYTKLTMRELIGVVKENYAQHIIESLDMVVTLLESAHKVEPGEEEVSHILDSMKKLRALFHEHSTKEANLLYPTAFSAGPKSSDDINAMQRFISTMSKEHDFMKKEMERVKKLTMAYQVSVSASPSHKLAYAQMNDVEQDLHRIIFVEEEYIFPRIQRTLKK